MGMARLRGRTSLIVLLSAGWVASAGADAVTDWNAIAVETIITAAPPTPQIDLGLVQAAVHDAVQAIDGRFEPYHVKVPGARGLREAAVAAAAHGVLVGFYPSQKDA